MPMLVVHGGEDEGLGAVGVVGVRVAMRRPAFDQGDLQGFARKLVDELERDATPAGNEDP